MKSDFHEKRQAQAERAQEKAEKFQKEADQRHATADQQSNAFYMGQPILVGHHSERRSRSIQRKMHANMDKSIEAREKAAHYAAKAERLADDPQAISSDDPEALQKLRDKLEALRWKQEQFKLINKAYREFKKKGLPALEMIEGLTDKSRTPIASWTPQYSFEKAPILPWMLSNLNAQIKTVEGRIEKLEALEGKEDAEYEINGVKIVESVTDNRVQMFFDGKPDQAIISTLRHNGFKWAPSVGAWMRMYSNLSIRLAKGIANSITA